MKYINLPTIKTVKFSLLLFLIMFFSENIQAQKFITRNGKVTFEASTPSFEEIKATNKGVSSILDTSTGDFVTLILIKSFKFKLALMEEHFNENYLESNKFPKAIFKGKIQNFDPSKLSKNPTTYEVNGDLTIHGVTKSFKTKVNMISNGGKIILTSNFKIIPQDFKVEIPSIVKNKIAKVIETTLDFELAPK